MTTEKPSPAPCLWCGGEVTPLNPPRRGLVKQYCSFRCKRKASVKRYAEKWPERMKAIGKKSRRSRDKVQAAEYFQANKERIMARRTAKPKTREVMDARRYYTAKHRAKSLGYDFTVKRDVWMAMTDGTTCFYCQSAPATEVDKIVPEKGYVTGNIAPACRSCNRKKSNISLVEFRNFTSLLERMTA